MSIEVECPTCHGWYTLKKGAGEVCTKCNKPISRGDRIYRLRQRVRQPDGKVVQHTKRLGRISRPTAEMIT